MTNYARPALVLLAAIAAIAGCKAVDQTRQTLANTPKIYVVANDAAPFYSHGPQQASGPDRTLPRDTLVRLIRPSFGYAKVQLLSEKQEGYISSDDIRVAPPNLVAAATPAPLPYAATSSTPTGEQFDLNSTDPRLTAPPDQLPAPDLPALPNSSQPGPSPGE